MSSDSKTFGQLSDRLQTALTMHQGMQDEWNNHIAQVQQREAAIQSSQLAETVSLAARIKHLLARAQLLNTRLQAVKEKGLPHIEPINVMHRLTDPVADMVGPETRAHHLKRALLQLTVLMDIREESVQELEDRISDCLPVIGDSLSKLWQGCKTTRLQSLWEAADASDEVQLLLERRMVDGVDLNAEEVELIAGYEPEAAAMMEKVRQEVRTFEGNVWLVLQTLDMFGGKMGRQRVIGEFFQPVWSEGG